MQARFINPCHSVSLCSSLSPSYLIIYLVNPIHPSLLHQDMYLHNPGGLKDQKLIQLNDFLRHKF